MITRFKTTPQSDSTCRHIRRGAYAKVVKGRDNKTGKLVAIKIYQKQKMDEDQQLSLEKQVHIMKNINHPNIVDFYGSYSDKNNIYLVLEYLSGGELYEHIIQKQQFSEKLARQIIRPLIDAINYLHDSGIVHRDLKPENIVYSSKDSNRILKIIDFGVSQIISPEAHYMSTSIGTPLYMAPQVFRGHKYDETVDWWSIGIILYVLLCGYPPFYSENQQQLQAIIKQAKLQFQPQDWDPVSPQAKDLVSKLLNANPKERFKFQQISQHPWILSEKVSDKKLDVPQKMKKFKPKVTILMNAMRAVKWMSKGKRQNVESSQKHTSQ